MEVFMLVHGTADDTDNETFRDAEQAKAYATGG